MVHVHGRDVARRAGEIGGIDPAGPLLVPVDVGKRETMTLVADATGQRVVAPFVFSLDRPGLKSFVDRVGRVAGKRDAVRVEVGVESAGHYHRPVTASGVLPGSWVLVELNPAHVTEQRKVLGKRGVKTDQIDLVAMFYLLVTGRGREVMPGADRLLKLCWWAGMRHRRVATINISRPTGRAVLLNVLVGAATNRPSVSVLGYRRRGLSCNTDSAVYR